MGKLVGAQLAALLLPAAPLQECAVLLDRCSALLPQPPLAGCKCNGVRAHGMHAKDVWTGHGRDKGYNSESGHSTQQWERLVQRKGVIRREVIVG
jgi:hypothetical protein